jgi:hypothetical protein
MVTRPLEKRPEYYEVLVPVLWPDHRFTYWTGGYASEFTCALEWARLSNHQTAILEALHACGAGTPEDFFKDECDSRGI